MSVPNATVTFWLIRAQVRVRLLATLISPFGHGVDDAVEVAQGRPAQAEVLDRAADPGDRDDVALAVLVLDQDQRAVEVVVDEALGAEADGDPDDAEPGDGRPDVEVEGAEDHDPGDHDDEEADHVRPPSSSSVSIRFWTSIADSSWAVPSVASRSSSALTIPWTSDGRDAQGDEGDDDDDEDPQPFVAEDLDDRAQRRLGEVHRERW